MAQDAAHISGIGHVAEMNEASFGSEAKRE